MPSSGKIDPAILALPYVDGVVSGVRGSDASPSDGNFDFTKSPVQSWKQMRDLIEAAGKPTRTEIDVGIDWQPSWLAAKVAADSFKGGKTFTFIDNNPAHHNGQPTIFVPWEPTALDWYRQLAAAFNAYNAGHPLVAAIDFPLTPFSIHNDFNPGDISNTVDSIPPNGSTPQTRWLATLTNSGFSTYEDALIFAGKSIVDSTRAGFKGYLTTSVGRINNHVLSPHSGSGNYISSQVVTYAASKGLTSVMKWNLNGVIPPSPGTGSAFNDVYLLSVPPLSLPVALQEVWRFFDDNCLTTGTCVGDKNKGVCRGSGNQGSCNNDATTICKQSVDLAISYGATAIEMFETDIKNCPDCAQYAHDRLMGASMKAPGSVKSSARKH